MKKLTISIVNYNAGEYLINCLSSIDKIKNELDFDVWVIDNNSSDGSLEKAKDLHPNFNYLKNKKNLGFGKAHNLVLKKAKTPYLLTLNPDTKIPPGVLKYILNFMEKNPDVGISTPRVEKPDGTLDKACHRGFPTPFASFNYFFLKNDKAYHLTHQDMTKIHEIDSCVGAFMFIRRSVLEKVGYFDEDYFLYGEDLDLCFRVKDEGFKIMYLPSVRVIHAKGISSGIKKHSQIDSSADSSTKSLAMGHFYETMKIFYKKHYSKNYPSVFNWLVYTGIDLKLNMAKKKKSV